MTSQRHQSVRSLNMNGNDRAILKLVLAKHFNKNFIKDYFSSSASQTFEKVGLGRVRFPGKKASFFPIWVVVI